MKNEMKIKKKLSLLFSFLTISYRCSLYGYLNLKTYVGVCFILIFYFTVPYVSLMLYQLVLYIVVICQVHSSGKYISMVILLFQCSLYKPTFHSGHLTCNMPHSGNVTIWIFCLP